MEPANPVGRKERRGWQAGTVDNKSNRVVYIAGDVGDAPRVVKFKPGEQSTDHLEDTDAVILDADGEETYKIGTADVTLKSACRFGSCQNVFLFSVDLEYFLNQLVGRAGLQTPEEAEAQGWIAPDGHWYEDETKQPESQESEESEQSDSTPTRMGRRTKMKRTQKLNSGVMT